MKIQPQPDQMTEQQKKHALSLLKEMVYAIKTIEESYALFCIDEENRKLVKRLIIEFNNEQTDGVPVDETMAFFHTFKMKAETEYQKLNASINKYN
jgi:hypothetical protein